MDLSFLAGVGKSRGISLPQWEHQPKRGNNWAALVLGGAGEVTVRRNDLRHISYKFNLKPGSPASPHSKFYEPGTLK